MTSLKPTATARLLLAALSLGAALPLTAEAAGRRGARAQVERHRAPERIDRRHDRRDDRDDRHERRHDRRDDRRDDRRFRDWNDWVEFRLKVAGAQLVAGMIFDTLPPDATVIVIDGVTYFVQGDTYLVKVVDGGRSCYRVVIPPAGAVVKVLGPGARIVRVGGLSYHLLDGAYYLKKGSTYVLVPAP
jgi:hypothetical protein